MNENKRKMISFEQNKKILSVERDQLKNKIAFSAGEIIRTETKTWKV